MILQELKLVQKLSHKLKKKNTKTDSINTNFKIIVCGVPQGSILPHLFLIYMNNLKDASNVLKTIIFADITNLFCSLTNTKNIYHEHQVRKYKQMV